MGLIPGRCIRGYGDGRDSCSGWEEAKEECPLHTQSLELGCAKTSWEQVFGQNDL